MRFFGLLQIIFILSTSSQLTPGKHNTNPVTACTGYNPAQLTFTTATTGGIPPYAFQWQLNEVAISGETLPEYDPPQITEAGTYSYNCAITDSIGDVVYTSPKLITIVPDPVVGISEGGMICQDSELTLTSTVTDGIGGIAYQWFLSADGVTFLIIPAATASTYSPSTAVVGTLYYRVNIYPSVGSCNNATSVAVSVTVNATPLTSLIYHN